MEYLNNPITTKIIPNVIPFNASIDMDKVTKNATKGLSSTYKRLLTKAQALDEKSKYPCNFNYEVYDQLEKRFKDKPPRGGIIFNGAFKLVNHHYSCQECLYAFMVDTYGRGCVHDCLYCYAKSELVVHGYWNKPFPMPININDARELFYNVFETDKKSKWRKIMEKRIPLRIGYASDSFMWMDDKYKITQELLKILKFYKYPYIIATRSDLVAHDDYLSLMDKDLCSIQMSIISMNDKVNKVLERGAPTVKSRLEALQKITKAGFWTTVRINPLFPIHADGFFTDPELSDEKKKLKLDIFDWDMIDTIADYNIPSILAGFGRFSPYAINQMDNALGTNLREFYNGKKFEGTRDYHYSDTEIRYYYEKIKELCKKRGVEFTTCYIGNGESFFWKDQDLWDNKHDCCNAKFKVSEFKNSAQEIPYQDRLNFCTSTCGKKATPQRELINVLDFIKNKNENPFLLQ